MMKRYVNVLLFAALATLGLAVAHPASAQTPENKAAAQTLFDRAMLLMTAGKYKEACSLLEESQRLDAGMAAQFRLASTCPPWPSNWRLLRARPRRFFRTRWMRAHGAHKGPLGSWLAGWASPGWWWERSSGSGP